MSPKLILYGNPVSCSQLHVKVALNEKGITDYTSITVEFVTQENKQPPYLERHPFGKIPAFEDQENGLKLFESRAIARYICAKYADQGTPGLLPDMKDPVAYGIFEQMFSVETCYWDNTTLSIAHEGLYGPKFFGREKDELKYSELLKKLDGILEAYNKLLEGKSYLCGEQCTLVDLVHLSNGEIVRCLGHTDLWEKYPNVNAWWGRISSRESWKKIKSEAEFLYKS